MATSLLWLLVLVTAWTFIDCGKGHNDPAKAEKHKKKDKHGKTHPTAALQAQADYRVATGVDIGQDLYGRKSSGVVDQPAYYKPPAPSVQPAVYNYDQSSAMLAQAPLPTFGTATSSYGGLPPGLSAQQQYNLNAQQLLNNNMFAQQYEGYAVTNIASKASAAPVASPLSNAYAQKILASSQMVNDMSRNASQIPYPLAPGPIGQQTYPLKGMAVDGY